MGSLRESGSFWFLKAPLPPQAREVHIPPSVQGSGQLWVHAHPAPPPKCHLCSPASASPLVLAPCPDPHLRDGDTPPHGGIQALPVTARPSLLLTSLLACLRAACSPPDLLWALGPRIQAQGRQGPEEKSLSILTSWFFISACPGVDFTRMTHGLSLVRTPAQTVRSTFSRGIHCYRLHAPAVFSSVTG